MNVWSSMHWDGARIDFATGTFGDALLTVAAWVSSRSGKDVHCFLYSRSAGGAKGISPYSVYRGEELLDADMGDRGLGAGWTLRTLKDFAVALANVFDLETRAYETEAELFVYFGPREVFDGSVLRAAIRVDPVLRDRMSVEHFKQQLSAEGVPALTFDPMTGTLTVIAEIESPCWSLLDSFGEIVAIHVFRRTQRGEIESRVQRMDNFPTQRDCSGKGRVGLTLWWDDAAAFDEAW